MENKTVVANALGDTIKVFGDDKQKALYAALVKAQAEVKAAPKGATNPHFKSKYADLGAVYDACLDALTKNGLKLIQFPGHFTEGCQYMESILIHEGGGELTFSTSMPVTKPDAQGCGSALTYMRRYTVAALMNVATEDDDGNAASQKPDRQALDILLVAIANATDSARIADLASKCKVFAGSAPREQTLELSAALQAKKKELGL